MARFGEANESILRLPRLGLVQAAAVPASARQFESLLQQIEDASRKAKALTTGRSQTDLTTSLEANSWSVAQCLDHLAQTTNVFLPVIAEAMGRAPRLGSNRRLRTGALTQMLIRNLEPPYRLRFRALKAIVPQRQDFASAYNAFEESQVRLAETIQSSVGLALDEVRIESPVYARVSYNVYGALRMLAAHQRRHLWQIEQILKALDALPHRNVS
jgi:hypothetical protein